MPFAKYLLATLLLSLPLLSDATNETDLGIVIPPEVFSSRGEIPQPVSCWQCCIYNNQSYTEGAIIKTEGILLQCARDNRVIGTNPLIWQRIQP